MGPKTSTERAVTIFQNKKNGGEAETKIGVTVENHLNAPDGALEAVLETTTGAVRGLHAGQARTGKICPLRKSDEMYRPVTLLEICRKPVMRQWREDWLCSSTSTGQSTSATAAGC